MGQVLAIDMRGPINCFSAVLPFMVDQGGGRIVNKASGEAVYAGCKAGLIGFSKTIANEMARHKINVSVVCPGRIGTPLLEEVTGGMQGVRIIEAMVKAVAWRRLAEPDEIASAVAFFASADTRFCAGQVLTVSGPDAGWIGSQRFMPKCGCCRGSNPPEVPEPVSGPARSGPADARCH